MKQLTIRDAGNDTSEVLLYGVIGSSFWEDGISAAEFRAKIQACKSKVLNLRIHSQGGDVFEANAMVGALDEFKKRGRVEVDVDGLAASSASYIACCGNVVRMSANGTFMIHNPYASLSGDADKLRSTAELLDRVKERIIATYQRRTKMSPEQLSEAMSKDGGEGTWYFGQETVDAGFADSCGAPTKVAALAFPPELAAKLGYNMPKILLDAESDAKEKAWEETNRRRALVAKA